MSHIIAYFLALVVIFIIDVVVTETINVAESAVLSVIRTTVVGWKHFFCVVGLLDNIRTTRPLCTKCLK